jgi:predicted signal transduction protein with EAL and GGDEF domain
MRTPLFFLAAFVAFFALPLDFTTAVAVLFSAGLIAISIADYRRFESLAAKTARMYATASRRERLRLAA